MTIFSNILEKLGIKKPVAPTAPAAPVGRVPTPRPTPKGLPGARPMVYGPNPPKSAEMPMVDVVAKLDGLAAKNPEKLNWRVSIVDLLKLLGMEATGAAIKELAVELNCPESEMNDSYKRNVWIHKTLLQKISENGGNIPQNLLN